MNSDYIEGAKARARKQDFRPMAPDKWAEGYAYMHDLLAPVEQEILIATLKYQHVATDAVRKLEESFRDACDTAGTPASPALPSERFEESSKST